MEFISVLIVISLVHLLAAASPGPDFVLITQQTLQKGKRAGLWCSLGITLGLSIHIAYSIAGLATIIAHSAELLWMVKILGGSYLIYLGVSGVRSKAKKTTEGQVTSKDDFASSDSSHQTVSKKNHVSAKKQILRGFLCNVLNPKAPIYFVSVFTIIISPELPMYQLLAYGVWMMVLQMMWFSILTLLFSTPKVSALFHKLGHWFDRVLGAAMVILGIKVLLSR